MTEPLASISININCLDNTGSGIITPCYTGATILVSSQFGVLEANAYRQGGSLRNGIHRGDPGYCGGVIQCFGDFHQSVKSIRASAGAEKWIIGNGISPNTRDADDDPVRGLNVWRWQGTRFQWVRNIDPSPLRIDDNDNAMFLSLVGDYAYARNATHNGYIEFDLNMLSARVIPAMPASEEQPGINGFVYAFEKVSQGHYKLNRSDAVPEPNELPYGCPNDKITRKEVFAAIYQAMLWLAKEHPADPATGFPGIQAPAVPPDQQFRDVPMDNIFRPAMDALKFADIIAGKPETASGQSPCTG